MDHELERLGRAVKQAQHRQHRAADAALRAIGTTLVQWDALRAIAAEPGASAHRLALATFQTDQAFGTLANRLEAQGMIVRAAGEGRRVEHRLSAKGEAMLREGNVVIQGVRGALYAGLGKADRRALAALLERVLIDDAAADLVLSGQNKRGRAKAAP
jgi:DNA-binding MarR family transcriptional regulator